MSSLQSKSRKQPRVRRKAYLQGQDAARNQEPDSICPYRSKNSKNQVGSSLESENRQLWFDGYLDYIFQQKYGD